MAGVKFMGVTLKLFRKFTSNKMPQLSVQQQIQISEALVKFCVDHKRSNNAYLENIRGCIKALEAGDVAGAIEQFKRVPLGGMSCFNDWCPQPVYEHETGEYINEIFKALVSRWASLMKSLENKT